MYLITYRTNWCDEMDIEGFRLYTKKEHDEWKASFDEYYPEDKPDEIYEVYYGTNQSEPLTREEILSSVEVQELSKKDFKKLKEFFPYGFGHGLPGY